MNTLDFVLNKFQVDKNQKSPIYLQGSRLGALVRLFRQLKFTVGAEIGVERGMFSKVICMGNPQLKFYGIDAWQTIPGYREHVPQQRLDKFYDETKERLKPFNCQLIKGWSAEVVKQFTDESLDFVYIDAAHDYDHVKEDIGEWSEKVRKNGIVSGHDYREGVDKDRPDKPDYGVIKAINEWVKEKNIKYLFILGAGRTPSWFYVKE